MVKLSRGQPLGAFKLRKARRFGRSAFPWSTEFKKRAQGSTKRSIIGPRYIPFRVATNVGAREGKCGLGRGFKGSLARAQTLHSPNALPFGCTERCARVKDGERRRKGTRVAALRGEQKRREGASRRGRWGGGGQKERTRDRKRRNQRYHGDRE